MNEMQGYKAVAFLGSIVCYHTEAYYRWTKFTILTEFIVLQRRPSISALAPVVVMHKVAHFLTAVNEHSLYELERSVLR